MAAEEDRGQSWYFSERGGAVAVRKGETGPSEAHPSATSDRRQHRANAWVGIAVLLCGCASSAESAPIPTTCQVTDRSGTYLAHLDKISGTCPVVPDIVVNLSAPFDPGGTTKCDPPFIQWAEGNCKLDQVFSCTDGPTRLRFTISTRQQTQNGSALAGTYGVDIEDAVNGCIGSYHIAYSRQ